MKERNKRGSRQRRFINVVSRGRRQHVVDYFVIVDFAIYNRCDRLLSMLHVSQVTVKLGIAATVAETVAATIAATIAATVAATVAALLQRLPQLLQQLFRQQLLQ